MGNPVFTKAFSLKNQKTLSKLWKRSVAAVALSVTLVAFVGMNPAATVPASAGSDLKVVSAVPGERSSRQQSYGYNHNQQSPNQSLNGSGSNSAAYYYNWSGYAATSSAKYVKVQSSFVQPSVTCTVPGAWTLFWVGFDGFTNGTVEQAGTAAQCSTTTNPTPVYYAWWEMYPTNTIQVMPISIAPGHSIQAVVTYNLSNSQYALTVNDSSNGQHYTRNTYCASGLVCARQSAEWIVERPTVNGAFAPLANWGTSSLASNLAANTYTYNRRNRTYTPIMQPVSAFNNTPINMVNYPYTGLNLATVGSLDASGSVFADTWQAAQ